MRKRLFITFLLLLAFTWASASNRILTGLFYGANHVRATLTIAKGSYDMMSGDQAIFTIKNGETADITASGGKVNVFYKGKNYAGYSKVTFRQAETSEFRIQPAGQKANSRIYQQNLIALSYSGRLQMVNEQDIENYVAGVIEAESGSGQELEYYKVQAVISRTYALNNLNRHSGEGFQICDATHCQVFHGKPRKELKAAIAAEATIGIVIVDQNINLITAAFHSNCGGHTVNAENVWLKPTSYLIGKPDTFCLKMPHSNWEKTITRNHWLDYLQSKRFPVTDQTEEGMSFYSGEKEVFYADSTFKIPMRVIREDLKLRSAFFNIQSIGDSVTFIGQGFGHGVGLCQEGAMQMARRGTKFEDIIHYYYTDVHLMPKDMIWFFQE